MPSERPRVSVLMPTYNRAALLGEAIASVLAQGYADLELLVIDDGSTDATPALLAAQRDARLRPLRQAHAGIGAALNAGLAVARGAYVARLDSDDVWLPDMLETMVAVLDARPEIGVVTARGQAMDAGGRPLRHVQGMPPRFGDDGLRSMVYDDFTCNIVTVARRECFTRAGGYDASLPGNEDWDMWLRIARQARFAFVDRILARYRWHAGNLTGPQSAAFRRILATRRVPLDKLFAQPDLPPAVAAMRADAYENVHLFCGLRLLEIGDWAAARREFVAALRVSTRPLRAAARIAWFTLVAQVLGRSAAGQRLVRRLTHWRRRWAPE
jgi:GT2 family glycosyltransferase